MLNELRISTAAACLAMATGAAADTLVLRDGTALEGTFSGASRNGVHFQSGAETRFYPLSAVDTLRFEPREAVLPEAASGAGRQAERAIIVGVGSPMVAEFTPGDAPVHTDAGIRLRGRLAEDFSSGGVLVAAAGSEVLARVIASSDGTAPTLSLTGVRINGALHPLQTSPMPLWNTTAADTDGDARLRFRIEKPFTVRLASG